MKDGAEPRSEIRLVYMGTAAFAVPTLVQLFDQGFTISGVVTQPDKRSGRGQTVHSSAVKREAQKLHLAIYQPVSLKDDVARTLFRDLAPDMIVVAAYGKILPDWLLRLPRFGAVNLHASLLPKYRGAAPIHWAIASGETETGVCTMQMDVGLDTGPVFLCERTSIGADETVTELSDRLAVIGAGLVIRTIEEILKGTLQPSAQDHSQATLAPILKKENGIIEWFNPAQAIHNQVRAFNPWPGTVTRFRDTTCKILKTIVSSGKTECEPGTLLLEKRKLLACCGNGTLLEICEIQPENRRPVSGFDFANGVRIQPGESFARMNN
jgi:methionyl-tRNA formyltransferase